MSNLLIICKLKGAASEWSAHKIRAENESKFDAIKAAKEGRPVHFTGEVRMNITLFLKKKRRKPEEMSSVGQ